MRSPHSAVRRSRALLPGPTGSSAVLGLKRIHGLIWSTKSGFQQGIRQ